MAAALVSSMEAWVAGPGEDSLAGLLDTFSVAIWVDDYVVPPDPASANFSL